MPENTNEIYIKLIDLYKNIGKLHQQDTEIHGLLNPVIQGLTDHAAHIIALNERLDAHEAYSGLFFNFLLMAPEARPRFLQFLELLCTCRTEQPSRELEAMQTAARNMIERGNLANPAWSESPDSSSAVRPPLVILHPLGENVIQFPVKQPPAIVEDQDSV